MYGEGGLVGIVGYRLAMLVFSSRRRAEGHAKVWADHTDKTKLCEIVSTYQ